MNVRSINCLVVDDSKVVRSVARRILHELDIDVAEAEHGEEALRMIRRDMPDVILLDMNMPVMDGMSFLHHVRDEFGEFGPTVICCSTENSATQVQKAIEAGASEYIMKPFDDTIIRLKLEQIGILRDRLAS